MFYFLPCSFSLYYVLLSLVEFLLFSSLLVIILLLCSLHQILQQLNVLLESSWSNLLIALGWKRDIAASTVQNVASQCMQLQYYIFQYYIKAFKERREKLYESPKGGPSQDGRNTRHSKTAWPPNHKLCVAFTSPSSVFNFLDKRIIHNPEPWLFVCVRGICPIRNQRRPGWIWC